jgi:hypothetical protein
MFAVDGRVVLLFIAVAGGSTGMDLASFLPADLYFESRKIPVSAERMGEIVTGDARNGKARIARLLAFRTLAEQPELVTKAANRDSLFSALERAAKGNVADDEYGFAQEYAARTLLAHGRTLDRPVRRAIPLDEMIGWFPQSTTLVAALLPPPRDTLFRPETGRLLRTLFGELVPASEWEVVFQAAEALGNVRIERVAVALAGDPKDPDRFFIRFTGKWSPKRIVDVVRLLVPSREILISEINDPLKKNITMICEREGKLVVTFIGDTDCVIAGFTALSATLRLDLDSGDDARALEGILKQENQRLLDGLAKLREKKPIVGAALSPLQRTLNSLRISGTEASLEVHVQLDMDALLDVASLLGREPKH